MDERYLKSIRGTPDWIEAERQKGIDRFNRIRGGSNPLATTSLSGVPLTSEPTTSTHRMSSPAVPEPWSGRQFDPESTLGEIKRLGVNVTPFSGRQNTWELQHGQSRGLLHMRPETGFIGVSNYENRSGVLGVPMAYSAQQNQVLSSTQNLIGGIQKWTQGQGSLYSTFAGRRGGEYVSYGELQSPLNEVRQANRIYLGSVTQQQAQEAGGYSQLLQSRVTALQGLGYDAVKRGTGRSAFLVGPTFGAGFASRMGESGEQEFLAGKIKELQTSGGGKIADAYYGPGNAAPTMTMPFRWEGQPRAVSGRYITQTMDLFGTGPQMTGSAYALPIWASKMNEMTVPLPEGHGLAAGQVYARGGQLPSEMGEGYSLAGNVRQLKSTLGSLPSGSMYSIENLTPREGGMYDISFRSYTPESSSKTFDKNANVFVNQSYMPTHENFGTPDLWTAVTPKRLAQQAPYLLGAAMETRENMGKWWVGYAGSQGIDERQAREMFNQGRVQNSAMFSQGATEWLLSKFQVAERQNRFLSQAEYQKYMEMAQAGESGFSMGAGNVPQFSFRGQQHALWEGLQESGGGYQASIFRTPSYTGPNIQMHRPEYSRPIMSLKAESFDWMRTANPQAHQAILNQWRGGALPNRYERMTRAVLANTSGNALERVNQMEGMSNFSVGEFRAAQRMAAEQYGNDPTAVARGTLATLGQAYGQRAMNVGFAGSNYVMPSPGDLAKSIVAGKGGMPVRGPGMDVYNALSQVAQASEAGVTDPDYNNEFYTGTASALSGAMGSLQDYINLPKVRQKAQGFSMPLLGGQTTTIEGFEANEVIASLRGVSRATGLSPKELRGLGDQFSLTGLHDPQAFPEMSNPAFRVKWFEDLAKANDPRVAGLRSPGSNVYMSTLANQSLVSDTDRDLVKMFASHRMGKGGQIVGGVVDPTSNEELLRRAQMVSGSEYDKSREDLSKRAGLLGAFDNVRQGAQGLMNWMSKSKIMENYALEEGKAKQMIGAPYNQLHRGLRAASIATAEQAFGRGSGQAQTVGQAWSIIGGSGYQSPLDREVNDPFVRNLVKAAQSLRISGTESAGMFFEMPSGKEQFQVRGITEQGEALMNQLINVTGSGVNDENWAQKIGGSVANLLTPKSRLGDADLQKQILQIAQEGRASGGINFQQLYGAVGADSFMDYVRGAGADQEYDLANTPAFFDAVLGAGGANAAKAAAAGKRVTPPQWGPMGSLTSITQSVRGQFQNIFNKRNKAGSIAQALRESGPAAEHQRERFGAPDRGSEPFTPEQIASLTNRSVDDVLETAGGGAGGSSGGGGIPIIGDVPPTSGGSGGGSDGNKKRGGGDIRPPDFLNESSVRNLRFMYNKYQEMGSEGFREWATETTKRQDALLRIRDTGLKTLSKGSWRQGLIGDSKIPGNLTDAMFAKDIMPNMGGIQGMFMNESDFFGQLQEGKFNRSLEGQSRTGSLKGADADRAIGSLTAFLQKASDSKSDINDLVKNFSDFNKVTKEHADQVKTLVTNYPKMMGVFDKAVELSKAGDTSPAVQKVMANAAGFEQMRGYAPQISQLGQLAEQYKISSALREDTPNRWQLLTTRGQRSDAMFQDALKGGDFGGAAGQFGARAARSILPNATNVFSPESLWRMRFAQSMFIKPGFDSMNQYMNQMASQDQLMMQGGMLGYGDLMGGEYGQIMGRRIGMQEAGLAYGGQVYRAYGGLANMFLGSQTTGSTLGAMAAVGGPAIGAGVLGATALGGPAGAIIGGGVAIAGGMGYLNNLSQDQYSMGKYWSGAMNQTNIFEQLGYNIKNAPSVLASGGNPSNMNQQIGFYNTANRFAAGEMSSQQLRSQYGANAGSVMSAGMNTFLEDMTKWGFSREFQTQNMLPQLLPYLGGRMPDQQQYLQFGQLTQAGLDPNLIQSAAASRNINPYNQQAMYGLITQLTGQYSSFADAGGNVALGSGLQAQQAQANLGVNNALRMIGQSPLSDMALAGMNPFEQGQRRETIGANASMMLRNPRYFNDVYGMRIAPDVKRLQDSGQFAEASRLQQAGMGYEDLWTRGTAYGVNAGEAIVQASGLAARNPERATLVNMMAGGDRLALSQNWQMAGNIRYQTMNTQTGLGVFEQNVSQDWIGALRQDYGGLLGNISDSFLTGGTRGIEDELRMKSRDVEKRQWQINRYQQGMNWNWMTGGGGLDIATGRAGAGDGLDGLASIFQANGMNFNAGNGMGVWQMEDRQRDLQRERQTWQMQQQQNQFSFRGQEMDLASRQFYEKWNMNYQQFQYGTQYQAREMEIGRSQQLTQRGWQQQDMAMQQNRADLNFGWQMEDYDRNIRFARGRDRLDMQRQRNRSVISFGLDQVDRERGRERFEKSAEWQDDEFDRRKKYFDQTKKWQEEELQMQKRHFEEKQGLDKKQFELAKTNFEKEIAWLREEWNLEDQRRTVERQIEVLQQNWMDEMNTKTTDLTTLQNNAKDAMEAFKRAQEDSNAAINLGTQNLMIFSSIMLNMASVAQQVAAGQTGGFSGAQQPSQFADGGYTGDGAPNKVAGVVHKKEYVVPEKGALVLRDDQSVQLLSRIASAMEKLVAMGPGRVDATIYTNGQQVKTGDMYTRSRTRIN